MAEIDPFSGLNLLAQGQLQMALGERKRQQDLADLAAKFDQQLILEREVQKAIGERETVREEAIGKREKERLKEEFDFRRQEAAEARKAEWERELLHQTGELQTQDAIEARQEKFFKYQKDVEAQMEKGKLGRMTGVYAMGLVDEAKEVNDIARLAMLPIERKNQAIYEALSPYIKDKKKLLELFNPEASTDNFGNLAKAKISDAGRQAVVDALGTARKEYRQEVTPILATKLEGLETLRRERRALLPFVDPALLDQQVGKPPVPHYDTEQEATGQAPLPLAARAAGFLNAAAGQRIPGLQPSPAVTPAAPSTGVVGYPFGIGQRTPAPAPAVTLDADTGQPVIAPTAAAPVVIPGERGTLMPLAEALTFPAWRAAQLPRDIIQSVPGKLALGLAAQAPAAVGEDIATAYRFAAGTPATRLQPAQAEEFTRWVAGAYNLPLDQVTNVLLQAARNPSDNSSQAARTARLWHQAFQAQRGQQAFQMPAFAPQQTGATAYEMQNPFELQAY